MRWSERSCAPATGLIQEGNLMAKGETPATPIFGSVAR